VPGINVNISDEAHAGWSRFAAEHGISMAVLFEVLGRHLADDVLRPDVLETIVREGRELTHERRRAGGPRRKKS
jgi:hypothetical protein